MQYDIYASYLRTCLWNGFKNFHEAPQNCLPHLTHPIQLFRSLEETKGAFKSCRIHRIYELNAHERHHKVVITSGKLEIFFKPRVSELGGVSVKKTCRMQWTQPKTKDMQRR